MSDELKDRLSAELQRELGGTPLPGDATEAMRRGRGKRTRARLATVAVVVAVVGGSVFAISQLGDGVPPIAPAGEDEAPPVEPNGDRTGAKCPTSKGTPADGWTSPTAFVAEGRNDGSAWVLCARIAQTIKEGGAVHEGLCMNWRHGQGLGSGMDCSFTSDGQGDGVPLDEDHFDVVSGPYSGYFYGAVPADAARIHLETPNGNVYEGEIHAAPEELGVPFRFFTQFAPPYSEGTLVVFNEAGEEIRRHGISHGLAVVETFKIGRGEGNVIGFDTLKCSGTPVPGYPTPDEPCRERRWVDCGPRCETEVDVSLEPYVRIRFVAEAAPGSIFVGWQGDCSGTNPECTLEIGANTKVIAGFDRSD